MSAVEAADALDIVSPSVGTAVPPHVIAQGLYERHSKRILGFCVRRLATREEAEDAVQTTFLHALRALQRGVVPVSETAWLFKIAENVCLATHRTNGRRRQHELAEAPELADDVADRESSREVGIELVKAIAAIPGNQRRALLLREWKGLSYREIAGQLGVSVAAVETLIFRARRRVVRSLNESGIQGRLAGVFDLGSVISSLKSALGGATAAKIAAAAAVLTIAATLPAGDAPKASAEPLARVPAPIAAPTTAALSAPAARASTRAPLSPRRDRPSPRTRQKPGRPIGSSSGVVQTSRPGSALAHEPPAAPALPSVHVPALPPVQTPALPHVSVPHLPAPPPLPSLPALPRLPDLPVQVPDPTPGLPALPHLP